MDDVVAYSRQRIERGSKSFATAARLFDSKTRGRAYMLYAWCRHCDDVIDGQDHGFKSDTTTAVDPTAGPRVLAQLERETRAALTGNARSPEFAALARVVSECSIPARHPLELIEGFRMDVEGRTYRTIDDTLEYCYHVAGVVGVMMARIMGVTDTPSLQRAQDLGLAFQLTNIARDVIDDANAGRLYLPADWLLEAGLDPESLQHPTRRAAVAGVVSRLLDVADVYYASARRGIPALPFQAAWAVASALSVYREIGTVVRQRGATAWDRRAHVGRSGKVGALLSGLGAATITRLPPLTATPPRDARLWTKSDLGG